jgi:proteasome lid subunit RPN8/RPN11
LRHQLAGEARAAFPRECCGLIEGVRREDVVEVARVHPARNLATEPDRFEIDPAQHIALLRNLRGTGRDIVGCYHSHPNGSPLPSARDLAGAADENFVWLIVSTHREGGCEIAAHRFGHGGFTTVSINSRSA